jgi:hypothetical protein
MTIQYPPVGSKWKDRDLRVARTVQVVRYDLAKRRVRIACLETERLTWAKVERFNGKRENAKRSWMTKGSKRFDQRRSEEEWRAGTGASVTERLHG